MIAATRIKNQELHVVMDIPVLGGDKTCLKRATRSSLVTDNGYSMVATMIDLVETAWWHKFG